MSTSNESSKVSKKSKKQTKDDNETQQLTKEESQIARFLRLNCPNRQGNFVGMKVSFFIGNKLVDCLVESKWGPGTEARPNKSKKQPYLASRQACAIFMQRLMNKQLFYRSVKVYKEQSSSGEGAIKIDSSPTVKKRKVQPSQTPAASSSSSSSEQKDNQSKRKFKLEMHEEQQFIDNNEPYVWIYDPTSTTTYIIGLLLIIGAIGICLFPLWPSQVREGVYYLSLTGATFLGAILGLAVLKYILFALIWVATLGKVSLWIFPNLTEDVGFLESFKPLYKLSTGNSSSTSLKKDSEEKTDADSVTEIQCDQPGENQQLTEEIITKSVISNSPKASINQETASTTNTSELSSSTLEINAISSDSPFVVSRYKNRNAADFKEDEGFELVDDDEDLVKSKDSKLDQEK